MLSCSCVHTGWMQRDQSELMFTQHHACPNVLTSKVPGCCTGYAVADEAHCSKVHTTTLCFNIQPRSPCLPAGKQHSQQPACGSQRAWPAHQHILCLFSIIRITCIYSMHGVKSIAGCCLHMLVVLMGLTSSHTCIWARGFQNQRHQQTKCTAGCFT